MPYPVQNLIGERGDPVSVAPLDSVDNVLELMIQYDFSQLPVIDSERRPLGIITYESILRASNNFGLDASQLRVIDALTKAACFQPDDDMFDLLDKLRDTNSVLIVDGMRKLVGIVTNYDSMEFFRQKAEDLMLVEDVESMVKDLIMNAHLKNNGEVDETVLRDSIGEITSGNRELRKRFKAALVKYLSITESKQDSPDLGALEESFPLIAPKQKQREFDQLTLNEYVELLVHPRLWDKYSPILQITSSAFRRLMDNVRETRNDLAHFRSEITPVQRSKLRFCVEWLNQHRAIPVSWPISTGLLIDQKIRPGEIRETPETYSISKKLDYVITPTEEMINSQDNRYTALALWLMSRTGEIDRLEVTFEEIEAIIGSELPASARKHRAWWANDALSHSQANGWLDAGWRTAYVNMTEGKLMFIRIEEREKAYIAFFTLLLKNLKKEADFPIKDSSPDGVSWITVLAYPPEGSKSAWLNYAFTLGKMFRVELYIDTGEKTGNKSIFDQLRIRRAEIESQIEEPLSWERIDDKRACRVAIYHRGSIESSKDSQLELISWGARSMIQFHREITPPILELLNSFNETRTTD